MAALAVATCIITSGVAAAAKPSNAPTQPTRPQLPQQLWEQAQSIGRLLLQPERMLSESATADTLREQSRDLYAALARTLAIRELVFANAYVPVDSRGRAAKDDIDEYYFNPITVERIRKQLDAGTATLDAGQIQPAAESFVNAARLMRDQVLLGADISGYWTVRQRVDADAVTLVALAKANKQPPPDVRGLEQQIVQINAHADGARFHEARRSVIELRKAYQEKAEGIRRAAAAQDGFVGEPAQPTKPCPATNTAGHSDSATTVRTAPRLDVRRSESTDNYYPPSSRRNFEEGLVRVSADVSASGCAMAARVKISSGFETLDNAALRWAVDGATFAPATVDGAATDATTQFNVRFAITD
jgi:TonB family protein